MKNKFLFVTLITILFTLVILINPVKAETSAANVYGTVDVLTGEPTITDDGNGNMIINFTKEQINNLKWVEHDDNGTEREKNGWWLGFKVTAPENADLDKSVYSDGKESNQSFKQVLDADNVRYCSFWVFLDENMLASHSTTWNAYKFTFNWVNKTENPEPVVKPLSVTVSIDPTGAKLDTTPENPENAGNIIRVTVDGKIFTMLKGETLDDLSPSDKAELNKLKTKEGYTFDGFFKTVDGQEVEVKETDPINEDTVLTSKFTKIEEPPAQPEPPQETPKANDTTPKTGVSNIDLIVLGIGIISLVGIIIVKKYC